MLFDDFKLPESQSSSYPLAHIVTIVSYRIILCNIISYWILSCLVTHRSQAMGVVSFLGRIGSMIAPFTATVVSQCHSNIHVRYRSALGIKPCLVRPFIRLSV